ncbi:Formyltransferase [Rhizopogon vinicolor AM-OR11-026]|uniref:methionyl-tRNA formyltransferase n=1 Tax=Rhizopogon vinicolor AM-OR11-026 TaxID=1314800 RepID=A0A1B7N9V4_9AGAM|nr:Formyltransferase [Rhizopogon vinicolor AM-OR11-026]
MHTQIFYHSARVTSRRKRGLLINCWNVHFYSTDARKKPFHILFFGRDQFSCDVFKRLHDAQDIWQSISIATNPDVKTGRRGSHLSVSPLKLLGGPLGVPVHTIPQRKVDFRGWLVRQPPSPFTNTDETCFSVPETHLLVTASFGRILSPSLLFLFPPGQRLNVHPSLLPAYRGPAPIQRALMQGEKKTGVCVIDMMEKKEGIDAGSVWGCESTVIPENATFTSLSVELARTGGDLLVKVLRDMLLGKARSAPQCLLSSTTPHAPAISASDAQVDFTSQTASDVVRLSRAISHQRPPMTTMPNGRTLQLHDVSVSGRHDDLGPTGPGWAVYSPHTRTVLVSCADGEWLGVLRLKTQDRTLLAAKEWWNGVKGLGLLHEGMLKLG